MDKKELKPYEKAFRKFRNELKKAILNEEVPMEFLEESQKPYYCEIDITVGGAVVAMTVAENFISYHNDIIKDLFEEGSDDFKKLQELAKRHVHVLTDEELEQIKFHEKEILRIKGRL